MRRTVEPSGNGAVETRHLPGAGGIASVEENERGPRTERRRKVAEHVAGTTVVLVGTGAFAIADGALMLMIILTLRIGERHDVMAMPRLPRGRLPAEGRREQGRQQNREQGGCDESGGATHRLILSHMHRKSRESPRNAGPDRLRGVARLLASTASRLSRCPVCCPTPTDRPTS